MRKFISISAIALIAATAAIPAAAQQTGGGLGSIVNCDAQGNRQAYGAILGGLAGAIVGNNITRSDNAPLVGAAAGAAAGSYVGCQQQRTIAREQGRGEFFATTNVNVRAGPSTQYGRLGTLRYGDRVQVVGWEGQWARIDLGRNGSGFVHGNYVQPTGR